MKQFPVGRHISNRNFRIVNVFSAIIMPFLLPFLIPMLHLWLVQAKDRLQRDVPVYGEKPWNFAVFLDDDRIHVVMR